MIKLSINKNIVNKGNPSARGWENASFNIDDLAAHIRQGFAFSPGVLKDNHNGNKPSNSDIVSAGILCVDIDNSIKTKNEPTRIKTVSEGYFPYDIAEADPWLHENALLMYTTPSHTDEHNRFRIVFWLPLEIDSPDQYKLIASAFIDKFNADISCKDVSRLFFGSKDCQMMLFGNKLNRKEYDIIVKKPKGEADEINLYDAKGQNGGLSPEIVADMLSHIPSQMEYNDWFKIVSAVGNYFDENTAIRLIDSWSPDKTVGTAYKIKHRGSNVKIASVIWMAEQYGFDKSKIYNFKKIKSTPSVKPDRSVSKKLAKEAVNGEIPEFDVRQQLDIPIDCIFWYEANKNGESKLAISKSNLLNFLSWKGIYKYWIETNLSTYVLIENNVVSFQTPETIYDMLKEEILNLPTQISENYSKYDLYEIILQKVHAYKAKDFLELIDDKDINFIKDTPDKAHFFFLNGLVIADRNEDELVFKKYGEFDGYVWQKQMINHEINLVEKDIATDTDSCMFGQFLVNVCKQKNDDFPLDRAQRKLDEPRLASLCSAIGYMLHTYKDPTVTKAVILCEEKIAGFDESNGRTGKGLTFKAVEKIRKCARKDGKSVDFTDRFFFQTVDIDTQLFIIDDAKKNLDFEALFSKMTEGITVERKNQSAFHIPFENSPKFLISTNYVLPNDSDSHKARKLEIEFSDYYSASYTPLDDFGAQFFTSWDANEWDRFYSFMMYLSWVYLQNGLVDYQKANLNERKLMASVPEDFIDYVDDLLSNLSFDGRVYRDEIVKWYLEKNNTVKSAKVLINWFRKVMLVKPFTVEEGRTNASGSTRRFFKLTKK